MNNKLEFANGDVIDGTAGLSYPILNLNMQLSTALSKVSDFMNPEYTRTIAFYYGAYKMVYSNFGAMASIEPKQDGTAIVRFMVNENSTWEEIPTVPVEYLPKE